MKYPLLFIAPLIAFAIHAALKQLSEYNTRNARLQRQQDAHRHATKRRGIERARVATREREWRILELLSGGVSTRDCVSAKAFHGERL